MLGSHCKVQIDPHGYFDSRKISVVNQLLVLDWAGPLPTTANGERFCLVVEDALKGFVFSKGYRTKTARDVCNR